MALEAVTRNGTRGYEWDGTHYPGVTTILGKLGKPYIGRWLAKNNAIYAAEHLEALLPLEEAVRIETIQAGGDQISNVGRDRGSRVHEVLEEYLIRGRDNTAAFDQELDPLDVPYILAGSQFIDDHIEELLYPEGTVLNRTYQYAGTADVIARLADGTTAIVDWKTGKKLYGDMKLQLVAYAQAENIITDELKEREMPHIDKGILVRLTDKGTYIAKEVNVHDKALWKAFVALRTVQDFMDQDSPLSDYARGSANLNS